MNSNISSRLHQYVSEFMAVVTSDGKILFVGHVENLRSHNSYFKRNILNGSKNTAVVVR
jgi:hypothetical protein